jgi:hypothetical protein
LSIQALRNHLGKKVNQFAMSRENIIQVGYVTILILTIISILMIYDTLSVFRIDRFALLIGAIIDVPLGGLLLGISLLVKWKDSGKTMTRKYVVGAGIVFGIAAILMSPLLLLTTG